MTNPFSGLVLLGAAIFSSPALHAALIAKTMSYETALGRFAVAWAVAWVGASILGSIGSSSPLPNPQVPRSLPGVDGPVPVRPAELHSQEPPAA